MSEHSGGSGSLKCSSCKTVLPVTAQFCTQCGLPQGKTKKCISCSLQIPSSSIICQNCHHNQNEAIQCRPCILCGFSLKPNLQYCPRCTSPQDQETFKSKTFKQCCNPQCKVTMLQELVVCYLCRQDQLQQLDSPGSIGGQNDSPEKGTRHPPESTKCRNDSQGTPHPPRFTERQDDSPGIQRPPGSTGGQNDSPGTQHPPESTRGQERSTDKGTKLLPGAQVGSVGEATQHPSGTPGNEIQHQPGHQSGFPPGKGTQHLPQSAGDPSVDVSQHPPGFTGGQNASTGNRTNNSPCILCKLPLKPNRQYCPRCTAPQDQQIFKSKTFKQCCNSQCKITMLQELAVCYVCSQDQSQVDSPDSAQLLHVGKNPGLVLTSDKLPQSLDGTEWVQIKKQSKAALCSAVTKEQIQAGSDGGLHGFTREGTQQPPGSTGGQNDSPGTQHPPESTGGQNDSQGTQHPPGSTGGQNDSPGTQHSPESTGGQDNSPGNVLGSQRSSGSTRGQNDSSGTQHSTGSTRGQDHSTGKGTQLLSEGQVGSVGKATQHPPGSTRGQNNSPRTQYPPGSTRGQNDSQGTQHPPGSTRGQNDSQGTQHPPGSTRGQNNSPRTQYPPGSTGSQNDSPGTQHPPGSTRGQDHSTGKGTQLLSEGQVGSVRKATQHPPGSTRGQNDSPGTQHSPESTGGQDNSPGNVLGSQQPSGSTTMGLSGTQHSSGSIGGHSTGKEETLIPGGQFGSAGDGTQHPPGSIGAKNVPAKKKTLDSVLPKTKYVCMYLAKHTYQYKLCYTHLHGK